jgi:FkbM family methyltransferase
MATKQKEHSSIQRDSKGGRGILAPGSDKKELSNLLTGRKYFVEIGTCYFDTLNETLGDAGWHGVVVEPVVKYLNMLDHYKGITYINSAIDDKRGSRVMDVYKEDKVEKDSDYAGMSAFTEYTKERNKKFVDQHTVSTITYEDAVFMGGIPRVDFLKVDTEGHDYTILSSIDFNNRALRPALIKAETKHYDSNKVIELLESNGYLVFEEAEDVYAIDKVVYL